MAVPIPGSRKSRSDSPITPDSVDVTASGPGLITHHNNDQRNQPKLAWVPLTPSSGAPNKLEIKWRKFPSTHRALRSHQRLLVEKGSKRAFYSPQILRAEKNSYTCMRRDQPRRLVSPCLSLLHRQLHCASSVKTLTVNLAQMCRTLYAGRSHAGASTKSGNYIAWTGAVKTDRRLVHSW